jgi:cytosine/adenosine deaminase-related metal-dependent hydrolase
MKQARPTVIYAAAVRDATGVNASPGAVMVQDGVVVAAGEPESLPAELVEQAEVVKRPNDLVLPAMVNAHTHLDLTDLGPQPYDPEGGFIGWVKRVRALAASRTHPGGVSGHDSITHRRWVDMHVMHAGIQAVGDIAPHTERAKILEDGPLDGVSYLEMFGIGEPFINEALARIETSTRGLQPHAPYSAGPAIYHASARSGRPVSTHLAETKDETAFVGQASGPMLDYLKSIGKWNDRYAAFYGQGLSPVQWMRSHLETAANDGGWLVAHCNYVSDDDIAILADTNTSVAYCPLASEYFGHRDHRYREMFEAGINVCLGTDSIVGTDPDDPQPLGLLSAMRRLYQRDETDPQTLLAMATTHGTRALRLDEKHATLQPGAPARFACLAIEPSSNVDPLVQVMTRQDPVEAISFEA